MSQTRSGGQGEERHEVLWPLSPRMVKATAAALRVPDLNGKTVC